MFGFERVGQDVMNVFYTFFSHLSTSLEFGFGRPAQLTLKANVSKAAH